MIIPPVSVFNLLTTESFNERWAKAVQVVLASNNVNRALFILYPVIKLCEFSFFNGAFFSLMLARKKEFLCPVLMVLCEVDSMLWISPISIYTIYFVIN